MALVYFVTGKISLNILHQDMIVTIAAFAPEGFALAGALIFGQSVLPGIFLGQTVLALTSHLSPIAAIGIGAVNTAEAALAVMLFHRFKLNRHLTTIRDLIGLTLLIIFVLQPFSALFGNLFLMLAHPVGWDDFAKNVFFWWFGNVMGQVLFTPLLLLLYDNRRRLSLWKMLVVVASFSAINVFFQGYLDTENTSVLLIATLPLTIYIATRNITYGTLSAVTVSLSSIILIHYAQGLFARGESAILNIVDLNFFALSHVVLALLVGVLFREKEEAIRHLKAMAHYDYLTGLPNRHLLRERIHHSVYIAQSTQTQNSICFVDLDGFKAINDTYGHHIGDQLLKEVVYILQTHTRAGDDLLRLGGDEFLIIYNSIHNETELKEKLTQILKDVENIREIEGCSINVSLSIGISWCPKHGVSVKDLMETADNAMYAAKKAGKNRYVIAA